MAQTTHIVTIQGKPHMTPGKKPLAVPVQALAEIIQQEWQEKQKFNSASMPLTALAYTAIDRIAGQEAAIVEALLVYVDTDTLSYRASGSEKLAGLQQAQWDPVMAWVKRQFGATWETTTGIMPVEQPAALHQAVQKRLQALDAMQLAAFCILASGFSSLALALAVLEKHMDAKEAFRLSRLEEDTQAEQWGRDAEAAARAARLQAEILDAERFLRLLDRG